VSEYKIISQTERGLNYSVDVTKVEFNLILAK